MPKRGNACSEETIKDGYKCKKLSMVAIAFDKFGILILI